MSVTTSQLGVSGRIVGGDAHNIKEFPFFASLLQGNFASCGGSIITPDYILSARVCHSALLTFSFYKEFLSAQTLFWAAHCFESGRASDWTVVVGISKGNQRQAPDYNDKFVSPVEMILVHDEYDPITLHADIAMLKMSNRIESWSDFIQPACIRWLEVRC